MLNQSEIANELDKLKQEIEESGVLYEECIQFCEPVDETNNIKSSLNGEIGGMQLHYYFPLTSEKSGLKKLTVFIKRVIRKLNLFLIMPIVTEQNLYNDRLCLEINLLKRELSNCRAQIERLEKVINEQNN